MNRGLITVLRKLKNALKQAFAMLIKIRFAFSLFNLSLKRPNKSNSLHCIWRETNNQRPFLGRQMGL